MDYSNDNEKFLNELQQNNVTMRYFTLTNNILKLSYSGEYQIHLNNLHLRELNPNLYTLHPLELFQILYTLELLYKENINEQEETFLKKYVQKYLQLNDLAINDNKNDSNRLYCLSIPIYTSYDVLFANKPSSIIISNVINEHTINNEEGKSKGPRLVLTNPNFFMEEEEERPIDKVEDFTKAGFTTISIIAIAVISTCLYLLYMATH